MFSEKIMSEFKRFCVGSPISVFVNQFDNDANEKMVVLNDRGLQVPAVNVVQCFEGKNAVISVHSDLGIHMIDQAYEYASKFLFACAVATQFEKICKANGINTVCREGDQFV